MEGTAVVTAYFEGYFKRAAWIAKVTATIFDRLLLNAHDSMTENPSCR
jgi:hypothetical protein